MAGSNIARLAIQIVADTRGLRKDVIAATGMVRGLATSISSVGTSAVRSGMQVAALLNPLEAIIPNLAQLKLYATAGFGIMNYYLIRSAAEMERTETTFRTLIGAGNDWNKTLQQLIKFAAQTPFTQMDVLGASKQLLAYGTEADQVLPTLQILGDAAAATGTELGDLTYLFGTLKTQGRAYTIDIRQFANRGIPIWEELAKVMNVNVVSMKKLVEEGKVGFPQVVQAFANMSKEGGRFHNILQEQSQTLFGLWTTLLDNIQISAAFAGKELADALGIKDLLRNAVNYLGDFQASVAAYRPAIKAYADTLKGVLNVIYQLSKGALAFVFGAGKALLLFFQERTKDSKSFIETMGSLNVSFKTTAIAGVAFAGRVAVFVGHLEDALAGVRIILIDIHIALIDAQNAATALAKKLPWNSGESLSSYNAQLKDLTAWLANAKQNFSILETQKNAGASSPQFMENYNETKARIADYERRINDVNEAIRRLINDNKGDIAELMNTRNELGPQDKASEYKKTFEDIKATMEAGGDIFSQMEQNAQNILRGIREVKINVDDLVFTLGQARLPDWKFEKPESLENAAKDVFEQLKSAPGLEYEFRVKLADPAVFQEFKEQVDPILQEWANTDPRFLESGRTQAEAILEIFNKMKNETKSTAEILASLRIDSPLISEQDIQFAAGIASEFESVTDRITTRVNMLQRLFDQGVFDYDQYLFALGQSAREILKLDEEPVQLASAIEAGSVDALSMMNQQAAQTGGTMEDKISSALERQIEIEEETRDATIKIGQALERLPLQVGNMP